MCGIAGYFGEGSSADLTRMLSCIKHRGPDEDGTITVDQVGFAHARLSIIDLTPSGRQPMSDAEKTITVVFNGEIYNFALLRTTLKEKGYQFVGSSDTEVIIAAYKEYKEECFQKFDGMFAIALYDHVSKKLFLARDRMGKKPLYWGKFSGTYIFASEPKAIFTHAKAVKKINTEAVDAYFALDYIPTPLSIWEGVQKLSPGTYLCIDSQGVDQNKYWTPDFATRHTSISNAKEQIHERLFAATKARLVSDVPLGLLLSGGLDSSAVAYCAKEVSSEQVKSFSIGFEEASFDESTYATRVADFFGFSHHTKILSSDAMQNVIPEIFALLDEPMADASIIPTFVLSQYTKEFVTVALGGDGGDELFAGYPTFQAEKMFAYYALLPKAMRDNFVVPFVQHLPTSYKNFSVDFRLKKFIEGSEETDIARRHLRWLGTFSQEERTQLFSAQFQESRKQSDPFHYPIEYFRGAQTGDVNNDLLWMYQRTYMMDQVLVKVDRASMYAGLEVRAPFLDTNIVEYVNTLPFDMKLRGVTTKYILKEMMRGKIPNEIIDRKKKGFGIPIGEWLRGPLKNWADQLLSRESLERSNILNSDYVRKLLVEHWEGKQDHRKRLWNIIVFQMWCDNFLQK